MADEQLDAFLQVVDKIESVNLHGVLKDRMVQRVRDLALRLGAVKDEVTRVAQR